MESNFLISNLMSSFIIVEVHTFSSERLSRTPLYKRVIRTRIATVNKQMELLPPTQQKIQPSEQLWEAELRSLRMNAAMLERYPSIVEFLNTTIQDNIINLPLCSSPILIPANQESMEVLLSLKQYEEKCKYLNVVCLSPAAVYFITGCYFQNNCTQSQMYSYLSTLQQHENDEEENNLMVDATDIDLMDFTDPGIENQCNSSEIPQESETDNIEKCFQLFILIQRVYSSQFQQCIAELFKVFNIQVEKYKPEIIKLEADKMLNFQDLEQSLGLSCKLDILDLRHSVPNLTYIKLYSSKAHPNEKLAQCVEGYNNQKLKLLSKPIFIDEFPNNPSVLLIEGVQTNWIKQNILRIFQQLRKAQLQSPVQNIHQFQDSVFIKFQTQMVHSYSNGNEQFDISRDPDHCSCYCMCQMDRDLAKKVNMVLGNESIEWGLICYEQFQQIRQSVRIENDISEEIFKANNFQISAIPSSRELPEFNVPTISSIQSKQDPSQFSSQQQYVPQVYIPPQATKSQVTAIRIYNIPRDVRIKEIANYAKITRVTEKMVWSLHQPFIVGTGPIKMLEDYVLFMFITRGDAERAVMQLMNSPFRGIRLDVRISEEPTDQKHIESCFQLKDKPPFLPVYGILLKAVTLPERPADLIVVVQQQWGADRPDDAWVHGDYGLLFYRDVNLANNAFVAIKQHIFMDHPNDISRQDYLD